MRNFLTIDFKYLPEQRTGSPITPLLIQIWRVCWYM